MLPQMHLSSSSPFNTPSPPIISQHLDLSFCILTLGGQTPDERHQHTRILGHLVITALQKNKKKRNELSATQLEILGDPDTSTHTHHSFVEIDELQS